MSNSNSKLSTTKVSTTAKNKAVKLQVKPTVQTMTSLEIAELTGKQHKDVLSDIRKMLDALKINSADFSAQYKDSTGRTLPMFNLPKRETLILVSGYDTVLRARVIDRMTALEELALRELSTRNQTRITGKTVRREFTDVLQQHGVEGLGYGACTNAIYGPLLGGTSKDIRKAKGLPAKANLRDHLETRKLVELQFAELMAQDSIVRTEAMGNIACAEQCRAAARKVASQLLLG